MTTNAIVIPVDNSDRALCDAIHFWSNVEHWGQRTQPRTKTPVRFRSLVRRMMGPANSPRGRMQDTLRRWFHNTAALVSFDRPSTRSL